MIKKLLTLSFALVVLSACSGGKSDYGSGLWLQGKGTIADLAPGTSNTVYFAFDTSVIDDAAKDTLMKQVTWWNGTDKMTIVIEGHCDERGTREYNLALGERRAHAVKKFLVSQGVPADKIDTVSFGKERPAVIGDSEEAWAKNRRAVTVPAK